MVVLLLGNSAGASPEDATYTFCYHHTDLCQDTRQFHRLFPQWALCQCRRNLYHFRVEDQDVWTWSACAEQEGMLKLRPTGTLGEEKDDALVPKV